MAKPSVALRLGLEGEESITSGFERIAASGDAAAKRIANDFERASAELDRALDRRNFAAQKVAAVSGGYSLGSDQNAQVVAFQRQMKLQQEQANALRDALNPLAVAQRRYDEEVATATRLLRAKLITDEEHAEAVRRSTQALAQMRAENTKGAANDNARRASIQNLGFQAQDFAVQVVGGTSALRALAQQAPQAISALATLGGAADGTATKFQRFIGFLGGPWGVALTVAGAVAIGLADKLLSGGEASEAAEKAARDHAAAVEHLNDIAGITAHTEDQRRAATLATARADRDAAVAAAQRARAEEGLNKALLGNGYIGGNAGFAVANNARRAGQLADSKEAEARQKQALIDRARSEEQLRQYADLFPLQETRFGRFVDTYDYAAAAKKREAEARKANAAAMREEKKEAKEILAAAKQEAELLSNARNLSLASVRGRGSIDRENAAKAKAFYDDLGIDPFEFSKQIASRESEASARVAERKAVDDQIYQHQKAQIAGVAEFYRSAFTGAGQSIGQTLKNVLLDAVTTALAKFTVKQIGGLLDNAGGFLRSLGIGKPAANAAGTDYFTGGMTWVAENGPELISLPRGARVTNAADTRRMMSAANDRAPVSQYFDLRGAVVTEDLYARMMAIGDAAAVRGAAGGSQMAQAEIKATGARKLGRNW